MKVRCIECSEWYDWYPFPGGRLITQRCNMCGGKLERMVRSKELKPYFYNKNSKHFEIVENKFIPISENTAWRCPSCNQMNDPGAECVFCHHIK